MQTASARVDIPLQRRSEEVHDDRLAEKCGVLQEERDRCLARGPTRGECTRRALGRRVDHYYRNRCQCADEYRHKHNAWHRSLGGVLIEVQVAALVRAKRCVGGGAVGAVFAVGLRITIRRFGAWCGTIVMRACVFCMAAGRSGVHVLSVHRTHLCADALHHRRQAAHQQSNQDECYAEPVAVGCFCHEATSEYKDIGCCLYQTQESGFRGSEWIAVCVRLIVGLFL